MSWGRRSPVTFLPMHGGGLCPSSSLVTSGFHTPFLVEQCAGWQAKQPHHVASVSLRKPFLSSKCHSSVPYASFQWYSCVRENQLASVAVRSSDISVIGRLPLRIGKLLKRDHSPDIFSCPINLYNCKAGTAHVSREGQFSVVHTFSTYKKKPQFCKNCRLIKLAKLAVNFSQVI